MGRREYIQYADKLTPEAKQLQSGEILDKGGGFPSKWSIVEFEGKRTGGKRGPRGGLGLFSLKRPRN